MLPFSKKNKIKKEMEQRQKDREQQQQEEERLRNEVENKKEIKNRHKAMTIDPEFVAFNNERIDNVDKVMEGFKTGGIDQLYTPQEPDKDKAKEPEKTPKKTKKKDRDDISF
jgi:hypothetical protein